LISALSARDVLRLTSKPLSRLDDPVAVLLAYVTFYDQRGGSIETSFKEEKQGLSLTKRSKKRFAAQQMVLLGSLAHNVLIWTHSWLAPAVPRLQHYGILRLVRDVLHISSFLVIDTLGQILQIVLNRAAPLATLLVEPLRELLAPLHIAVYLGDT
jgi:hypothetical protein